VIPDNHFLGIAEKAVNGYGALQDEWEFAMLLQVVQTHHPAKMLEIGSYTGGSLYGWRTALPDCHVFAVTLGEAHQFHSWGASVIFGDSTHPDTQTKVWEATAGVVDFVFIDGGHDDATAAADFEMALKLTCQSRGMIGVHDINLYHRYPELSGPRNLWDLHRRRFPSIEFCNRETEDPGFGLLWNR
jgi:predicted O-methyltransferase YrrM